MSTAHASRKGAPMYRGARRWRSSRVPAGRSANKCAIVRENLSIHDVDVSIATRALVEVQSRPQPLLMLQPSPPRRRVFRLFEVLDAALSDALRLVASKVAMRSRATSCSWVHVPFSAAV